MLTQILQKSFQLSNKEEYIDITHWIPKDMDLNRKVNHTGLVDIKENMICIFIILSWPLILQVIQKCNADSTIRTLYMLELSLLKKKMLFENRFYWWSLLDKNYFGAWCPSFKICFYGGSPFKKPGVLGWVIFLLE